MSHTKLLKLTIKYEKYLSGKLLLFHVCTTSGSDIPCCKAWSSRKSNIYLMAKGRAEPR